VAATCLRLWGIAGTAAAARAISGRSGMGVMYELDAIAAVVIVDHRSSSCATGMT
jgi:ribose/xylose/arabinose/galactoside ABC-type transport system permease subunit